MKKLILSLLSLLSLAYPQFSYGDTASNVELWKIFCAHRLMVQPTSSSGDIVVFEDAQWQGLVADLNRRAMPTAFVQNEGNLDAWLKCENEFADRFVSAEFLSSGRAHFLVAPVTDADSRISVAFREGGEIYADRWNEFLTSLQKVVTLSKARNTISMRSR